MSNEDYCTYLEELVTEEFCVKRKCGVHPCIYVESMSFPEDWRNKEETKNGG